MFCKVLFQLTLSLKIKTYTCIQYTRKHNNALNSLKNNLKKFKT